MSRGFGLKPLAGAGIPEFLQNGPLFFAETRSSPVKKLGARHTLAYMPTGTCRFLAGFASFAKHSRIIIALRLRCKTNTQSGRNMKIERLHRAMLVERDPESLRST